MWHAATFEPAVGDGRGRESGAAGAVRLRGPGGYRERPAELQWRPRPTNALPHPVTGLSLRQGSAKTKMLLPLLGRSSGVIALQREALPPVPVPATTYWRPSTA